MPPKSAPCHRTLPGLNLPGLNLSGFALLSVTLLGLVSLLFLLAPLPALAQGSGEERILTAEDGSTVAATLHLPDATRKSPAVILLHPEGDGRDAWAPYIAPLVARGYVVLDSNIQTLAALDTLIAYLRDHPAVDEIRIGALGAGHGANLAIAANHHYALPAVALSPDPAEARRLAGLASQGEGEDLELEGLFTIASANGNGGQGAAGAQELYEHTAEPRRIYIVPDSAAQGVAIFGDSPITLERVLWWLKERL